MKKSAKVRFRFSYLFGIFISLVLMMWIADVSSAQFVITGIADPPEGGVVTPTLTTVPVGGSIQFAVSAMPGYYIHEVTVNGETKYLQNLPLSVAPGDEAYWPTNNYGYTINGVFQPYTLVATFKRYYNISLAIIGRGAFPPAYVGPIATDDLISYQAIPDAGYELVDIKVNGQSQGPVSPFILDPAVMGGEATEIHIEVIFVVVQHTLTVTADAGGLVGPTRGGGTIGPSGGTFQVTVIHGTSWPLTIMPSDCYKVASVTVDGTSIDVGDGEAGTLPISITKDITVNVDFEQLGPFTLKVTANKGGTVRPTADGGFIGSDGGEFEVEVACGEDWPLIVTPDVCYRIKDIRIEGVSIGAEGEGAVQLPLVDIRQDLTVEVEFEEMGPFTIKVRITDGGNVGPKQDGSTAGPAAEEFEVEVQCGGGWIFKITPYQSENFCFEIKDVKIDGQSVGPLPEVIFSGVMKDYTLYVIFEEAGPFTITTKVSEGDGSFDPEGDDQGRIKVNCGEDMKVSIVPGYCHKIKQVWVDGKPVSLDGKPGNVKIIKETGTGIYTFENVRENHTVTAAFEIRDQFITVKQNPGGRITPEGVGGKVTLKCGSSQTFTITPDECFRIESVIVDGQVVEVSINRTTGIARYTFSEVTDDDHTIEATFEKIDFFIIDASVDSDKGGSIDPAGEAKVPCAADQTFTITIKDCYGIDRVEVDGEKVDVVAVPGAPDKFTYTFKRVVKNQEIKVFFKKLGPFTITGVPLPNGKVEPVNPKKVECGEDQTITIIPNDCWEIDWITINGEFVNMAADPDFKVLDPKTGKSQYTFRNVRKDYTITVQFKKIQYLISVIFWTPPGVPGPGGFIAPAPGFVDCGTNVTYRITASPGYRIAQVWVDGKAVGPATTVAFKDVREDHDIDVLFVKSDAVFIAATAGKGGNISPLGNVSAPLGTNLKFEVTADEDFEIEDVKVDDESVGPVPEYTFENLAGDHTISATFVPEVLKGDVNGDGRIRSNDAILALRIVAGLITPTEEQKRAADMNGDGVVRSDDAILILRKAAGLVAPGVGVTGSAGRQVNVTLADVHGIAGETVTVPVMVDNTDLVAGGDICIAYDSSVLRSIDVSSEADMLLIANTAESGTVRIAFAGNDRLSSEILAKIQFDVLADDFSPLIFTKAELYSPDALPLSSECIDRKFKSWAMVPERSALMQNFPNPFNPETWIPYQLKDSSEVEIRVFSVAGELVRELSLGYRPAGLYVTKDRAAYWDGRNEHGEKVASGIYFYSLRTGDFSAVRKLTVLE